MNEIYVGKSKVYPVPSGAEKLQIVHETGDIVLATTAVVTSHSFTPDSIGVHKFIWMDGDNETISTVFYSSVVQLTTESDFFDQYPTLETANSDNFLTTERVVRHIIETFTGQKFGPLVEKTITVAGDGGDSLSLPMRITVLDEIVDNWEEDFTDLVEIARDNEWYLKYIHSYRIYRNVKRDITKEPGNFFDEYLTFTITGNFGWEWVPTEVSEAAKLLIADAFTGTNDLRSHGVNEAQLGDFSYKLNADQWGTTGNTQADLLLAPYVVIRLGLV